MVISARATAGLLVLVLGLVLFAGCERERGQRSFVQFTNSAQTKLMVWVADDPVEQSQGLAEVEFLSEAEGMLFLWPQVAPRIFWMKGVEYPIDIIWLRRGVIFGITEQVQPEAANTSLTDYRRYPSPVPVDAVIEVRGGLTTALKIEPGQLVSLP